MPTRPERQCKWIALSNVALGVLPAVLDGSIVLIAMPSIFRGIHLDRLVLLPIDFPHPLYAASTGRARERGGHAERRFAVGQRDRAGNGPTPDSGENAIIPTPTREEQHAS